MKTRSGFVSNSSSSSFILIMESPATSEHFTEILQLPKQHPLHKSFKSLFEDLLTLRYATIILNLEDLLEYILEDNRCELPQNISEEPPKVLTLARKNKHYAKIIEAIEEEKVYLRFSLSYNEDEEEMAMAHQLSLIPNIPNKLEIEREY